MTLPILGPNYVQSLLPLDHKIIVGRPTFDSKWFRILKEEKSPNRVQVIG